ncbi:butyrophilin subfamily 3 member A2-like isoform X1 [Monodelphis domestica]|uniref:butyrophilin subfamily 3 member A2-like isoform X1 n=1 Tax=Monodelphis domestica TaxID=13616 RepID=UPI0024E24042|nr:butyrophilin subfamily 3 member A2-like isoform X1 [Monodelphis domestica]
MKPLFLPDLIFIFLVLLLWPLSEEFTVVGPQQPIVALVGTEVTLPCYLHPQLDATYMEVIWFHGQNSNVVHRYKYAQDYLKYQHPDYRGRTEFLRENISHGSVALRLHQIRPSDEGKYRCFFESPSHYNEAEFQLKVIEEFTVIGPQQPIVALVGTEVTLPCYLHPQLDATYMEVIWFHGQNSSLVHRYKNAQDYLKYQHPDYRGRTEFLWENISHGSVALRLHQIRPSDEGKYRCFFESPSHYHEAEFQVSVTGIGSAPHIYIDGVGYKRLHLVCTSTGWYPEPEVQWKNHKEEPLSGGSVTMKKVNGLFSVETSITVSANSKENVSCVIGSPHQSQKKEAHIAWSDGWFSNIFFWIVTWIVSMVILVIIMLFIIVFLSCKLKKAKVILNEKRGKDRLFQGAHSLKGETACKQPCTNRIWMGLIWLQLLTKSHLLSCETMRSMALPLLLDYRGLTLEQTLMSWLMCCAKRIISGRECRRKEEMGVG